MYLKKTSCTSNALHCICKYKKHKIDKFIKHIVGFKSNNLGQISTDVKLRGVRSLCARS